MKNKIKTIFIVASILFLASCLIFYAARFIKYYKLEHPSIKKDDNLYKLVTLEKNMAEIGDGLYKKDKDYIFKGKNINNYVLYSGLLWRVVGTDNKNVRMVRDSNDTILVYGINTNYSNSYISKWLENYYNNLNNKDIIIPSNICINKVSSEDINCTEKVEKNIGILSASDYIDAGAEYSYLNNNSYFWLSNIDTKNNAWYVYNKGKLNSVVSSGEVYYPYGVRALITVKGDTKVMSGDGSKEKPYNLDTITSNMLKDKYIGSYITYSNYNWQIIEKTKNYVKVAMDGVIKVDNKDYEITYGSSNVINLNNGIGKYLNEDFYNSLDNKELIIKHDFYNGIYSKKTNYNYTNINSSKVNLYVGLMNVGDLFINTVDNYYMMTRASDIDNTIYEIDNNKAYVGSVSDTNKVRPVIYLKPDIVIESGKGLKTDPYMVK